ncbi:SpoIIE family protein phosphatase [Spirulina sp. CS-785/01]|uniref:PP2C family protein-serine/threonine phosphatase n=1 Tax=Spirulina sp. CS-785/01 TaxID=3021716 RepID=UPI0023303AFA|nr:GAF domain-containing SpoIIE family protein phosphatase [Spirulina sp. CS-785/01]MDB9311662.1 SpoIIE family protein phosphatase [Spirulina sp. CS-785/01]
MTAAPIPHPNSSHNANGVGPNSATEETPVSALKELVAKLHREQNRIQNLLSSLGFALRSFNNLNQFLEIVPLMVARVTDADGGALVLLKPNGEIHLEQLHCQEGHACQDIRQALENVIKQAEVNPPQSSPVELNTVDSVSPTLNWETIASLDEQLQAYLGNEVQLFGTPILVKNEERGRLYVFSRDLDYGWTATRKKLVQLVADQTAVAIANNELASELRQKERLDRELEIASEIQDHLLPGECPQIEGVELAASCKTANRVGGDYYDFIPTTYDQFHPENTQAVSSPWSIVIGDVMGKGVPAGLIMTMTRGMLRAEVLNRHSPAKILRHLNRVMYADLENAHRFLTMFYSEYDPKTHLLSFTNAAHNPPLFWQAKSQSISKLDTWGMLIGLEIDSQYEDGSVQLDKGDTVIFYTDGLTEAMNAEGQQFNETGLTKAFEWACQEGFNAQQIHDHLFQAVQQFVGKGHRRHDDMTLVVMQVTE